MAQNLLFVCLGNICRSPAAENIMNHLINQANLRERITCDSAGTGDYNIGEPLLLHDSKESFYMEKPARSSHQTWKTLT